jgi:thiamine-phosphate pyrophosphorylase
MREKLLSARLYGILDTGYTVPKDFPDMTRRLLDGGVNILQIRAKNHAVADVTPLVEDVFPLCDAAGVPLIVNDFPELGPLAHGVHLGQEDGPLEQARTHAGAGKIFGRSTHSLAQAARAAAEGADYIGFGPLLATPTKPGRPAIGLADLQAVHRTLSLPIFCIGGIKLENLEQMLEAGARRVVIVSGLLTAANPTYYAQSCRALLDQLRWT